MPIINRPRVLTLVSHYLPGFKAGGPIRSVANLVAALGQEFDFRIVTRDRDVGDVCAYAGVQSSAGRHGAWQPVGHALVLYLRPSTSAPLHVARAIERVRPTLLYVNSFFDAKWSLPALATARAGSCGRLPIVIAPRGQFSPGALQFKAAQKKLYLAAFRSLGLGHRAIWQATSEAEAYDIRSVIGRRANVVIAANLSAVRPIVATRAPKQAGRLNLAYLSRISPKKNLLAAIDALATLSGDVCLDIWGPIEDEAYADVCRQQIASLPTNVHVQWCGHVEPDHVAATLSRYDAMILPTLGENFGHAILESLAAACPVVISDRTPWRNLTTHGAGWDLPLERPELFRDALQAHCQMDELEHARLRQRAVAYATASVRTTERADAHRELFRQAIESSRSRRSTQLSRAVRRDPN